jgi:hypothetical protein
MFNVAPSFSVSTLEDLTFAVASFAGFTASVRRIVGWRKVPRNLDLERDDKLDIQFFWNTTLRGVRYELDMMTIKPGISILGPLPEKKWWWKRISLEEHEDIVRRIVSPPHRVFSDGRQVAAPVVHFACHCDTGSQIAGQHMLVLGGSFRRSMQITLDKLTTALARLGTRDAQREGPLAFVNACGGTNIAYDKSSSIPQHYLSQLGYRGVVGPLIAINDGVASEFAEVFYEELLDGHALGVALVRARRRYLEEMLSPIGLAYVCFGESDLRIE